MLTRMICCHQYSQCTANCIPLSQCCCSFTMTLCRPLTLVISWQWYCSASVQPTTQLTTPYYINITVQIFSDWSSPGVILVLAIRSSQVIMTPLVSLMSGMPQSSNLGPMHFISYMECSADIFSVHRVQFRLFADDVDAAQLPSHASVILLHCSLHSDCSWNFTPQHQFMWFSSC